MSSMADRCLAHGGRVIDFHGGGAHDTNDRIGNVCPGMRPGRSPARQGRSSDLSYVSVVVKGNSPRRGTAGRRPNPWWDPRAASKTAGNGETDWNNRASFEERMCDWRPSAIKTTALSRRCWMWPRAPPGVRRGPTCASSSGAHPACPFGRREKSRGGSGRAGNELYGCACAERDDAATRAHDIAKVTKHPPVCAATSTRFRGDRSPNVTPCRCRLKLPVKPTASCGPTHFAVGKEHGQYRRADASDPRSGRLPVSPQLQGLQGGRLRNNYRPNRSPDPGRRRHRQLSPPTSASACARRCPRGLKAWRHPQRHASSKSELGVDASICCTTRSMRTTPRSTPPPSNHSTTFLRTGKDRVKQVAQPGGGYTCVAKTTASFANGPIILTVPALASRGVLVAAGVQGDLRRDVRPRFGMRISIAWQFLLACCANPARPPTS